MSEKSGNKKKIRIIPLFVSIIIPLLIGWLSTLLVPNMRSIYESLIKPPFSPPAIVFSDCVDYTLYNYGNMLI